MNSLELVRKFENCILPKAEWTHQAHLTVGLYYCMKYPAKAFDHMKRGIIRYNESVGTINSDDSGYHETITLFWIWVLKAFLKTTDDKMFGDEIVNKLLNSSYADKNFPLKHYTEERLLSKEARKTWILPDLKKLEQ